MLIASKKKKSHHVLMYLSYENTSLSSRVRVIRIFLITHAKLVLKILVSFAIVFVKKKWFLQVQKVFSFSHTDYACSKFIFIVRG